MKKNVYKSDSMRSHLCHCLLPEHVATHLSLNCTRYDIIISCRLSPDICLSALLCLSVSFTLSRSFLIWRCRLTVTSDLL